MAQILRTTLINDETVAADGQANYDLPVNPLSCILLTVKALNETVAPATYSWVNALLSMISSLRVTYRGATIIDGSLTDLAVLMAAMSGWQPRQLNAESLDNQVRAVTVPILFGRRAYDPLECFPATRRGDLVLSLTRDIAVAGADNLVLQAETIELLDAEPQHFIKVTTQSPVAFAAGQNFVELPIGNQLLGLLLRGFNVPNAADYQSSFGQVALLVDNVEVIWSETNWETLHGELGRRLPHWSGDAHRHHMAAHVHLINGSGAAPAVYAQANTIGLSADADAASLTTGTAARSGITGIQAPAITHTLEQEDDVSLLQNYALLDLDPLGDAQYALNTTGAAQVRLRVTADAADATQSRVLPIEWVQTTTGRAAA